MSDLRRSYLDPNDPRTPTRLNGSLTALQEGINHAAAQMQHPMSYLIPSNWSLTFDEAVPQSLMPEQPIVAAPEADTRLTLALIHKSNFTCFPEAIREEMRAAVHYMEETAASMGGNPQEWDIAQVLKHPDGDAYHLIKDKRAINKRVYDRIDQDKRGVPEALTAHEKKILKEAEESHEKYSRRLVEQARESKKQYLQDAENYERSIRECLMTANNYQNQIESMLKSERVNLVERISEVVQNPFWKLVLVEGSTLYFESQSDVILVQRNHAARINLRVNMGRYKAVLHINDAELLLKPLANNLVVNGIFHPYASVNGSICWGNATTAAQRALVEKDYKKVMDLLQTLLQTYSPSATPYMSLHYFQIAFNQKNPGAAQVIAPDESEEDEDFEPEFYEDDEEEII